MVTTAEGLGREEMNEITAGLKRLLKPGQSLALEEKVDPTIIGGACVWACGWVGWGAKGGGGGRGGRCEHAAARGAGRTAGWSLLRAHTAHHPTTRCHH